MLCNLARSLPRFVGDFLDKEAGLKRRFREETLTDLWVASLIPFRGSGVYADLSIESDTGADLELWFLSRDLRHGVGFAIQAKRAECRRHSGSPFHCIRRKWESHRFPELDHRGGEGRARGGQARDLVRDRSKRRLYPLYAFYMPSHVYRPGAAPVQGVMLADGHEVRRRIVQGLWDTRRRSRVSRRSIANFKRLDSLIDLMMPLSRLFCSPADFPLGHLREQPAVWRSLAILHLVAGQIEILNIPKPHDVAADMANGIRLARGEGGIGPLPEVTEAIPPDIRQLALGEGSVSIHGGERGGRRARARIVFVSTME